jgi:hypothetical protein
MTIPVEVGRGVLEMTRSFSASWCLLLLVLTLCLMTGCAAGPNPYAHVAGISGIAGFWTGLWHGFIMPVTFVISLFNPHVSVYEVHNNGGWYNFGFLIGLGGEVGIFASR